MLIILPNQKTYPPAGRCIYCPPSRSQWPGLTREHIVPDKFGGKLILPQASCLDCQAIINKEIETPMLTKYWKVTRALLNMKTTQPITHVPASPAPVPIE